MNKYILNKKNLLLPAISFVFLVALYALPTSAHAQSFFQQLWNVFSQGTTNTDSSNTEVILSGDFNNVYWKQYKTTLVQQDVTAHGGFSIGNAEPYANQATADRLCSLLDPAARASVWRSDSYASAGNNSIILWNGSSWERHGAKNYNRHLRYQFTCVKTAASGGADLTAGKPTLNSGSFRSGEDLTFRSTISNQGTSNALGAFDVRFQLDVGNDGVYDLNLDSLDEITNLNAASSQTNTTTILSGDFNNVYWKQYKTTLVQQDVTAHGGFSIGNAEPYANQATADRLCSLLDPAARASVWRSDSYASAGNNSIILWNGSSWERHGAKNYNRHLRYQFTCVKDTVNESEAESKDAISPIWIAEEGTHAVRACADLPGDDISESNEGNNCGADYTFTVQGTGISVSLTAVPSVIFQGQLSLLSWQSQNALFCRSSDFSILGGALQGFTIVTPQETTEYTITCEGEPNVSATVSESTTETQTSQSGTWEYEFTDYTDLWCPATQSYYPQCSTNSPGGTNCDPSTDRICAVDSGQCTIRSDVYRCAGETTTITTPGETTVVEGAIPIATDSAIVTVIGGDGEEIDEEEGGVPECSDTIDNDGDGLPDYPNDPGCVSQNDDDERNSQCIDGIDNDGDGNVDYPDDPGCASVLDDDEGTIPPASITLEANPTLLRKGDTTVLEWTAVNVQGGSCSLSGSNNDSWSLVGVQGSEISSPLEVSTTFTLACTDLRDDPVSLIITVSVIPSFQEI